MKKPYEACLERPGEDLRMIGAWILHEIMELKQKTDLFGNSILSGNLQLLPRLMKGRSCWIFCLMLNESCSDPRSVDQGRRGG